MEWSEFKQLLDQSLDNMLEAQKEQISINDPYTATSESLWQDNHIKNYKKAAELVSFERMGVAADEPIPDYAYRVTDDFFQKHHQQIDHQSPEYLKYCEAVQDKPPVYKNSERRSSVMKYKGHIDNI